jgi:hypothetical protein
MCGCTGNSILGFGPAKAIAVRGYFDSRRGRLDTGEAWFRLGLEDAADESARVRSVRGYHERLDGKG